LAVTLNDKDVPKTFTADCGCAAITGGVPLTRTTIAGVTKLPMLFTKVASYRPASSATKPLIVRLLPLTVNRVPLPTLNTSPFLRHTTELTVPTTSSGKLLVSPNPPKTSFGGATDNRGAPIVVNRTPGPFTAAPGPASFIRRT
jgi:hypothetical protein